MSSPSSEAISLDQAGHALRQVLLRLNQYAESQAQRADPATRYGAATLAHLNDLQALLTAVEQYEQAVLASLVPAPVDVCRLTPVELRAYREADPVYRLGWVRGHKVGVAQTQRATEPVLTAYAQRAALPAPVAPPEAYAALVQRITAYLAQLTQRRNHSSAVLYGTH